jgi:hypothetical protein
MLVACSGVHWGSRHMHFVSVDPNPAPCGPGLRLRSDYSLRTHVVLLVTPHTDTPSALPRSITGYEDFCCLVPVSKSAIPTTKPLSPGRFRKSKISDLQGLTDTAARGAHAGQ